VGADAEAFAACYDGGEALDHVLELDETRRARGIFTQPVFDVNGEQFFGSQSFNTFAQVIEGELGN
jgi:2-hydroxychromene-2-carboxylate isomerase